MKKNCRKLIRHNLELKKGLKGKKINYMLNGKDNNSFNNWIDKKRSYKMSQYFPLYRSHSGDIKVELDLSNYATKTDLENVTHADVSSFASKTNLASLKTEVDKINVDK